MNSISSRCTVKATRRDKTRTATTTRTGVKFDATTHRNRFSPAFAAGLTEPSRWTGQHAYAPFDQSDAEWAAAIYLEASAAEIDAEEQAYHEMLDHLALEDAAVSKLARGFCL